MYFGHLESEDKAFEQFIEWVRSKRIFFLTNAVNPLVLYQAGDQKLSEKLTAVMKGIHIFICIYLYKTDIFFSHMIVNIYI